MNKTLTPRQRALLEAVARSHAFHKRLTPVPSPSYREFTYGTRNAVFYRNLILPERGDVMGRLALTVRGWAALDMLTPQIEARLTLPFYDRHRDQYDPAEPEVTGALLDAWRAYKSDGE